MEKERAEKAEKAKIEAAQALKAKTQRLVQEVQKRFDSISTYETPLSCFNMSVRSYNCLQRFGGIETAADLLTKRFQLGEYEFVKWLLSLHHMGAKSAEEVNRIVTEWINKEDT